MDRSIILLQAVEVVKSFGYKCFFPRYASTFVEKPTYCFITDGTNIGYMQANDFGSALDFSTIHKPHSKYGTGVGVANNVLLKNITKELIEQTFGKPCWTNVRAYGVGSNNKPIIKYASWEDYAKNSLTGKICREIVEL